MKGCYSLTAAASNPEMVDMLPHMRGQGVMDLEFESDGGCGTLVCLLPLLTAPLPPVFPLILSSYLPTSLSLPLLCAEPVSTPPAHRHEVTYVKTHKGPSLAAIFSCDGMSEHQKFLKLQESVLSSLLSLGRLAATASADCSIKVSSFSMLQREGRGVRRCFR